MEEVEKTNSIPNPPKKPMAAFFLYKSQHYHDFVKTHPEKKIAHITKLISEQWTKEPQEVKDRFQQKYHVLKKKFDEEMKAFIESYGKPPIRKRKIKKEKKDKKEKKEKKAKIGSKSDKSAQKQNELNLETNI